VLRFQIGKKVKKKKKFPFIFKKDRQIICKKEVNNFPFFQNNFSPFPKNIYLENQKIIIFQQNK